MKFVIFSILLSKMAAFFDFSHAHEELLEGEDGKEEEELEGDGLDELEVLEEDFEGDIYEEEHFEPDFGGNEHFEVELDSKLKYIGRLSTLIFTVNLAVIGTGLIITNPLGLGIKVGITLIGGSIYFISVFHDEWRELPFSPNFFTAKS